MQSARSDGPPAETHRRDSDTSSRSVACASPARRPGHRPSRPRHPSRNRARWTWAQREASMGQRQVPARPQRPVWLTASWARRRSWARPRGWRARSPPHPRPRSRRSRVAQPWRASARERALFSAVRARVGGRVSAAVTTLSAAKSQEQNVRRDAATPRARDQLEGLGVVRRTRAAPSLRAPPRARLEHTDTALAQNGARSRGGSHASRKVVRRALGQPAAALDAQGTMSIMPVRLSCGPRRARPGTVKSA